MSFNKHTDEIAITIPAFRMRKSADLGKNEIGIITIAIDANGVSNPTPSVFTNSFFIPNVKKWTWVKFGGQGRIVYGPKNPGSFVYYNVLFVESDQDVREFGDTLQEIFDSSEAKTIIQTLATINPTALLITSVVSALGKLVGKILSKNKNDLIYSTEGSFFQGTNPPYNIGDQFNTVGDHIECEIKVLPLIANNEEKNLAINGIESLVFEKTLINSELKLELLAGVPEIVTA